jgi:hypothetical protein
VQEANLIYRAQLQSPRSFSIATLFLVGGVVSAATTSTAIAQCIEDDRRVTIGSGALRMKGYLCKTKAEKGSGSIRIEYLNLEEPLASLLLSGGTTSHFTRLLGKPRVADNDVLKSFNNLRAKFGFEHDFSNQHNGDAILLDTTSLLDKNKTLGPDKIASGVKLQVLPAIGNGDFPDGPGIEHVTRETTWPKGYGFFYSKPDETSGFQLGITGKRAVVNTAIWRYLISEDIEQFSANIDTYNTWIKRFLPRVTDGSLQKSDGGMSAFERHILSTGFPADYQIVYGSTDAGCGDQGAFCCWNFTRTFRMPSVDVAIIQNTGSTPAKIASLLGTRASSEALRKVEPLSAGSVGSPDQALAESNLELAPGMRILVPLRLRFDVNQNRLGEGPNIDIDDVAGARAGYAAIQSVKPGTVLQADWSYVTPPNNQPGKIRKVRESFAPPTQPKRSHHAFGPEIQITGMEVGGEKIVFAAGKLNEFVMNVSISEGSCPFMLAWNKDTGRWTEYGKMLHKANMKSLQQTDVRRLDGWRGTFRLEEREAEVAFIDMATLHVELRDGKTLTLEPDNDALKSLDQNYVQLLWGDAVEFSFKLPNDVKEEDVLESRLALSGYYERYSRVAQR